MKTERLWKLRLAIDELLQRKKVSGNLLEIIVGHITWTILVRRECLSLFSSVFRFIDKNQATPEALWDSVRWGLKTIRDIILLLSVNVCAKWHETVIATDSSETSFLEYAMHSFRQTQ